MLTLEMPVDAPSPPPVAPGPEGLRRAMQDVLANQADYVFDPGIGFPHVRSGKVRMLGDGSGRYAKALGLELDLVERGLGVRVQRFSALVVDGVVKEPLGGAQEDPAATGSAIRFLGPLCDHQQWRNPQLHLA